MTKKTVSAQTERLAGVVFDVCRQVQREMGPECLEVDYQRALAVEFQKRGVDYSPEVPVLVTYHGVRLIQRKADFEVRGPGGAALFLEIKARDRVTEQDQRQGGMYASWGPHSVCLLVNFGESPLYVQSFVGAESRQRPARRSPESQVFYATHKVDAWERNPPEKWPERGFNRHISSTHEPRRGDALLIYRFPASTSGAGICEVYRLGQIEHAYVTEWLDRFGRPEPTRPPAFGHLVTDMRLVARLRKPVTYSQMGTMPAIRRWNRWRGRFRGISNADGLVPLDVWQALRRLIVDENPDVADTLHQLGV